MGLGVLTGPRGGPIGLVGPMCTVDRAIFVANLLQSIHVFKEGSPSDNFYVAFSSLE